MKIHKDLDLGSEVNIYLIIHLSDSSDGEGKLEERYDSTARLYGQKVDNVHDEEPPAATVAAFFVAPDSRQLQLQLSHWDSTTTPTIIDT